MAVAAGAAGGFGTDATEVSAALAKAASPDGVLVLMDLGSAVLSAELALELAPPGCARAAQRRPARRGSGRRRRPGRRWRRPGDRGPRGRGRAAAQGHRLAAHAVDAGAVTAVGPANGAPDASERLTLVNPLGLHARPAAQIATAVGALEADVAVESGGQRADAASSLELLTLGAGQGCEITVSATGADAERAVATVRELVVAGFGELEPSRA